MSTKADCFTVEHILQVVAKFAVKVWNWKRYGCSWIFLEHLGLVWKIDGKIWRGINVHRRRVCSMVQHRSPRFPLSVISVQFSNIAIHVPPPPPCRGVGRPARQTLEFTSDFCEGNNYSWCASSVFQWPGKQFPFGAPYKHRHVSAVGAISSGPLRPKHRLMASQFNT